MIMTDNSNTLSLSSGDKKLGPLSRTSENVVINDTDKSHPTSLTATSSQRKKSPAFQITSVTIGSQTSNDGDDSGDDLDESHTDDMSDVVDSSRVTDVENETPSCSEDTFSKDDALFNYSTTATSVASVNTNRGCTVVSIDTGTKILVSEATSTVISTASKSIPTVTVCPTDPPAVSVDSPVGATVTVTATATTIPTATVTVVSTAITTATVTISISKSVPSISFKGDGDSKVPQPQQAPRNDRFRVVKIETTEPFKRGRWMCMDYLDHSAGQHPTLAMSTRSAETSDRSLPQVSKMNSTGQIVHYVACDDQNLTGAARLKKVTLGSQQMSGNTAQFKSDRHMQNGSPRPQLQQQILHPQQLNSPRSQNILVNSQPTLGRQMIRPQVVTSRQGVSDQNINVHQIQTGFPQYYNPQAGDFIRRSQPMTQVTVQRLTQPEQLQQLKQQQKPQQVLHHSYAVPHPVYINHISSNVSTVPLQQKMTPSVGVLQQQANQYITMAKSQPHSSQLTQNQFPALQSQIQKVASPNAAQIQPSVISQQNIQPAGVVQQPTLIQHPNASQLPLQHQIHPQQLTTVTISTSTNVSSVPMSSPKGAAITTQIIVGSPPSQQHMSSTTSKSASSALPNTEIVKRDVKKDVAVKTTMAGTGEGESATTTNAVAIDNKIEQAMDLVKSHLMFAVREEVEVLKEKISELTERISQLESENTILRAHVPLEVLAQLSAPLHSIHPRNTPAIQSNSPGQRLQPQQHPQAQPSQQPQPNLSPGSKAQTPEKSGSTPK